MEIYQVLKKEHDHMKDLFAQVNKEKHAKGNGVFAEIKHDLGLHLEIEEKLFYSALKDEKTVHEKMLEAFEEHNIVKNLLNDLSNFPREDERWMAKMKVLQELVEHHIEEEEGEIFKKAKKVLDKGRSEEIGSQFESEKEKNS